MLTLTLCLKYFLLKIEDVLKLQQLNFYFKYCHNKLPFYFCKPETSQPLNKMYPFEINKTEQ